MNAVGRSAQVVADERLEDELIRLARAQGALREVSARLAARFVATQGWSQLGFARLGDHARERLGTSARSVRDWACVGARLDELPELRRALALGRLPWSKVRLLTRFVEPENERGWIGYAEQQSVKTLEGELRAVDRGALEAGAMERAQEEKDTRVRISVPFPLAMKWQRTKRQASRIEGVELSAGEVPAGHGSGGLRTPSGRSGVVRLAAC